MRKTRMVVLLVGVCILTAALAAPVFAADVQALIEEFISDPVAGIDQMIALAQEDPETAALVLAGVAERSVEIRRTDPTLADSLESGIGLVCIGLVHIDPYASALIVNTVKDRVPEIGERVEKIVVAVGLEEQYLRAASPVSP